MRSSTAVLVALIALAALALFAPSGDASLTAAAGANARARAAGAPASLRRSADLWATIDICSPIDQPDYVGVRGSMPGDLQARDEIYMRFRLQYKDTSTNRWVNLRAAASRGFIRVGSAKTARQDGFSFQLVPVAGRPATTLRGVVTFQWRRGATVLASISRPSTAGHESVAGADPPNYSAATCSLG
jgi:hypothetical protein